jgi:hypothetical protein
MPTADRCGPPVRQEKQVEPGPQRVADERVGEGGGPEGGDQEQVGAEAGREPERRPRPRPPPGGHGHHGHQHDVGADAPDREVRAERHLRHEHRQEGGTAGHQSACRQTGLPE